MGLLTGGNAFKLGLFGINTDGGIAQRCATAGRHVQVFTACHVVCRETQREADDYYRHYAADKADAAAVDFHIAMTAANRQVDTRVLHDRVRRAAGLSSYPLVGTPEHIADELIRIQKLGYAGTSLSFVNFQAELGPFIEHVLPRLVTAGLRAS